MYAIRFFICYFHENVRKFPKIDQFFGHGSNTLVCNKTFSKLDNIYFLNYDPLNSGIAFKKIF